VPGTLTALPVLPCSRWRAPLPTRRTGRSPGPVGLVIPGPTSGLSRPLFPPLVTCLRVFGQAYHCPRFPALATYTRKFSDRLLLHTGTMREGTIGQATVRVVEARQLLELDLDPLRVNPRFLLAGA